MLIFFAFSKTMKQNLYVKQQNKWNTQTLFLPFNWLMSILFLFGSLGYVKLIKVTSSTRFFCFVLTHAICFHLFLLLLSSTSLFPFKIFVFVSRKFVSSFTVSASSLPSIVFLFPAFFSDNLNCQFDIRYSGFLCRSFVIVASKLIFVPNF